MKKNRNLQIEALRGIAIILVITYHIFDRFQQIYCQNSIFFMNSWGNIGVNIFFIISGFYLIDPSYIEYSYSDVKKNIIKLMKKLYPGYFICISLCWLVTRIYPLPGRTVSFNEYMANVFLVNRWVGMPYVDGAHWYLSVLIEISVIVFLIMPFNIYRRFETYIIWSIIAAIFSIFFKNQQYYFGGPFISIVEIGIALRFIINGNFVSKKVLNGWRLVIILDLVIILWQRGIVNWLSIIIIIPIFLICQKSKCTILNNKVLIYIGGMSFYIYLTHQNMAYIIEYFFVNLVGKYSYIFGIIALGTTFIFAWFLKKVINKLFVKT